MGEKEHNSIDCPPMFEEIVVFGNIYVQESRNFFLFNIKPIFQYISVKYYTSIYNNVWR